MYCRTAGWTEYSAPKDAWEEETAQGINNVPVTTGRNSRSKLDTPGAELQKRVSRWGLRGGIAGGGF